MNKVAIIGGGLTGLAAAHRLNEIAPRLQVNLFETADKNGGVLFTESLSPFLVEHSADMFTTMDPAALDLCERIGFSDQLIGTNQEHQRAFIAQGSQLVPVPRGLNLMTPSDLKAIETTTLLSGEGRHRFLEEESVPSREGNEDESLASFAVRRFGQEAYDRIIQPLVGGIYTADPDLLSLRATLPQYLEMESRYGSVIRATREKQKSGGAGGEEKSTSGARYNMFVAPKGGMTTLIEAIENHLTHTQVRTCTRVKSVKQLENLRWQLQLESGDVEEFDAVILTCPADRASDLIRNQATGLSEILGRVQFASSAIVVHGYDREQISHPLDGFGFVVPICENRKILAGSFSSIKFKGRAEGNQVLTRTFIGGGCQPELLQNSDSGLIEIARRDLSELLGIQGMPMMERVIRWKNSMPQYHLGHLKWVEQVESEMENIAGLEVAGKSFRGVGIPACVRSGENAAQRVAEYLRM